LTDALLDQAPEVRDSLAEARELEARGQYQAAANKSEEAVSLARKTNRQPLVAEAAYLQGRLQAELAQWSSARTTLTTAIANAEVGGCTTLAIDAMNELARVDGLDTTTAGASVDFWPVVSAKIEAIGGNQLRRARALKNYGLALQRKRTIAQGPELRKLLNEQAAEQFRQALVLQKSVHPEPLDEISTSYRNLGLVMLSLGDHAQALELLDAGLKKAKEAYGQEHPAIWRGEFDYGHALITVGDAREAETHLQRALQLAEKAYDRDNNYLARIHLDLARAYDGQYEYLQSLTHATAAAEVFLKAGLPRENKHRYAARRMQSYAHEMLGEYEKALALRLELADDARRVADDPAEEIVISTIDLGQTYVSLGRWDDALSQIELGQAALLPGDDGLREELDQLHALALAGQGDPAAVPALRELEKKARELTVGKNVALIDIDTWAHLAFALAKASCSRIPSELPDALRRLPTTPRLAALQHAIDLHDPVNCKPLATNPDPKK
jgi:tetratricopeptide (TPR) repeat protein